MEKIDKIMDTWAFDKDETLGDEKGENSLQRADWGGWGYTQDDRKNTLSSSWKRARTMARTKS